ncbi:MAG: hypothetical protein ACFCD0_19040 [Gemmataceae bacterium]
MREPVFVLWYNRMVPLPKIGTKRTQTSCLCCELVNVKGTDHNDGVTIFQEGNPA